MSAAVSQTANGFAVKGYEELNYDFQMIDNVFDSRNKQLADCYQDWGRVLVIVDENIKKLYGADIQHYFDHFALPLTFHAVPVGENAKTIETMLGICDAMTKFGVTRKEPVLVVGGGLVTDVAGFSCACYRRSTNFIRVPTTLIGLIDASVSIKVAVNHGSYKNRLGAYHPPIHTFLDFSFLKTLPIAQVRNGFAELIKISSCVDLATFDLLDMFCEDLIETKFGRVGCKNTELREIADRICYDSIYKMLKLESPNLHEIMLDRVIAFGHTWSPLHELQPAPPLRHGHAISVDMAFSVTLAQELGLLSKVEQMRFLTLLSRSGLAIDHPLFNDFILEQGTAAILKTRDGQLRLAVPSPLGTPTFINEFTIDKLKSSLRRHKDIAASLPRQGTGLESLVDDSDVGDLEKIELKRSEKLKSEKSLLTRGGVTVKS